MGILRDSIRRDGRSHQLTRPGDDAPGVQQAAFADPAPGRDGATAHAARAPVGAEVRQAIPPGDAAPAAPAYATPPAPSPSSMSVDVAGQDGRSELRRRRDALAEQVAEMHWDLGGLAYEMAIRDHFRLDVLVRRAAALQERDAELAEIERLLRSEEEGIAGECPACRAPHSRGAIYCWQCGTTLMQLAPSAALEEQPTAAMDSLLPPEGSALEPGGGHRSS